MEMTFKVCDCCEGECFCVCGTGARRIVEALGLADTASPESKSGCCEPAADASCCEGDAARSGERASACC